MARKPNPLFRRGITALFLALASTVATLTMVFAQAAPAVADEKESHAQELAERAAACQVSKSVVSTSASQYAAASVSGTFAGFAANPNGGGFWITTRDGRVTPTSAGSYGDMSGQHLNGAVVGIAATPSGNGYWLVGSDGGIFSFGDAHFHGSMGSTPLNRAVIGMAATPSGNGYWLFAADGGVFAFGDAAFAGSTGAIALNSPIVGMTPKSDGSGYWLVAADGGVFAFAAKFYGSMGGTKLNQPVVGALRSDSGAGYWLVAADGGVFSFGDASFYGSVASVLNHMPVAGIATRSAHQAGYLIVQQNGTFNEFGPDVDDSSDDGACNVASMGAPAYDSNYAFTLTRNDGSPVRWSACAPVHWAVSSAAAPSGAVSLLQTAFQKLSAATGLTFVYDGTTSARASSYVDANSWDAGNGSWKPILVDFEPSGGAHMCGTAGCATYVSQSQTIVSGVVMLNKDAAVTWTGLNAMGDSALHELGHIVGLAHVSTQADVMEPVQNVSYTDYQAGDKAGLYLCGLGSAALDVEYPSSYQGASVGQLNRSLVVQPSA